MNMHTTHAAEGLERRAFTIADVEQMVEVGILARDERFELIGGEIVPMSPKGIRHESLKVWLCNTMIRLLPDNYKIAQETTLRLSEDTFIEPDFLVLDTDTDLKDLGSSTIYLAIEVADSSLKYDLGRKAEVYAGFDIKELWVINAKTLETRIHLDPVDDQYQALREEPADVKLVSKFLPALQISLKDFS